MAKKSYVSLHDRAYKGDVRQYFSLPTFVLIIYSFPIACTSKSPGVFLLSILIKPGYCHELQRPFLFSKVQTTYTR